MMSSVLLSMVLLSNGSLLDENDDDAGYIKVTLQGMLDFEEDRLLLESRGTQWPLYVGSEELEATSRALAGSRVRVSANLVAVQPDDDSAPASESDEQELIEIPNAWRCEVVFLMAADEETAPDRISSTLLYQ